VERKGEQNNKRLALKDRTVPRDDLLAIGAVTVRVVGEPWSVQKLQQSSAWVKPQCMRKLEPRLAAATNVPCLKGNSVASWLGVQVCLF